MPSAPGREHIGDAELPSRCPVSLWPWVVQDGHPVDAGRRRRHRRSHEDERAMAAPGRRRSRTTCRVATGPSWASRCQDHRRPSTAIAKSLNEGRRIMSDFLGYRHPARSYEQLPRTVRRLRAPKRSRWVDPSRKHDEDIPFPYEVVSGMALHGLVRSVVPSSTSAWRDYFALCWRWRNSQGRTKRGHQRCRQACRGRHAVYRFRNDSQKQEMVCRS